MNFGLDIFMKAVVDVYVVWKFGVGETRIGDDINELSLIHISEPTRPY